MLALLCLRSDKHCSDILATVTFVNDLAAIEEALNISDILYDGLAHMKT